MRMHPLVPLGLIVSIAGTVRAQSHEGATVHDAVRNALSAAPPSIAAAAAVIDGQGKVLRAGTNGWTCMPDNPDVPNNSPMCLDKPWMAFLDGLMSKRAPQFEGLGIGYMLQEDMPTSNLDPFAPAPTPHNQWVPNAGAHVMLIVSDVRLLAGLPTDPANGGPWVMWKGTPYAHVMVPVPQQR